MPVDPTMPEQRTQQKASSSKAVFDLRRPPAPVALIWQQRAQRNIERMLNTASRWQTTLRPHFKTHQSVHVGEWFRQAGVQQITVSSPEMALKFAEHGWRDISIAVPMHPGAVGPYRRLVQMLDQLHLITDDPRAVADVDRLLSAAAHPSETADRRGEQSIDCWIEIDTGDHRTGIPFDDAATLRATRDAIVNSTSFGFVGLMTHAGHTYHSKSREAIEQAARESRANLFAAREALGPTVGPVLLSYGDTPSCSIVDRLEGLDEIRPGTFVFYDLQQQQLGSCGHDEIALAVACPVLSVRDGGRKVVIHGGAVHFSKDTVRTPDRRRVFGRVALPTADGWSRPIDGALLTEISQEHGEIEVIGDDNPVAALRPGDGVVVLPAHACLCMDLMRHQRVWVIN